MTATLAAACFVTGLITGWILRTGVLMAEISRIQEQMQNKIRYWQSETFHARHRAESLARQLRALGHPPRDPYDDPPQNEY
jgi:hypothetical protein